MADQNPVVCPDCGATYHVVNEAIGRRLRCSKCRTVFTAVSVTPSQSSPLPDVTEPQPAEAEPFDFNDPDMTYSVIRGATKQPAPQVDSMIRAWFLNDDKTAKAQRRTACAYLGIFLLVVFLVTVCQPPNMLVLLNYVSLFLGTWCLVVAFVEPRLPDKWYFRKTATLAAFVACFAWSGFDYYEKHWTRDDSEYRDWTHRWSGVIASRRVWTDGEYGSYSSGAMSGDPPKPHGHWIMIANKTYHHFDYWFWYGEKITQGEWELRNRK